VQIVALKQIADLQRQHLAMRSGLAQQIVDLRVMRIAIQGLSQDIDRVIDIVLVAGQLDPDAGAAQQPANDPVICCRQAALHRSAPGQQAEERLRLSLVGCILGRCQQPPRLIFHSGDLCRVGDQRQLLNARPQLSYLLVQIVHSSSGPFAGPRLSRYHPPRQHVVDGAKQPAHLLLDVLINGLGDGRLAQ